MAFFEELGRKAKDVAAVAADKAKDMAAVAADKARETTEKTKISVAIAGEQREIEKNCRLIGEWFINEYEGELPEGVQELADAVAASKARIAELEEQKNAIKAVWRTLLINSTISRRANTIFLPVIRGSNVGRAICSSLCRD